MASAEERNMYTLQILQEDTHHVEVIAANAIMVRVWASLWVLESRPHGGNNARKSPDFGHYFASLCDFWY